MARVTARRTKKESGLARVCQSPRGYEISITGHGQVASVIVLSKGYHDYYGWSYLIYEDEKLGFPRIEAWQEPGVVPKGKSRRFRYTDEGLLAAKDKCIKRVKELMQKS